MARVHVRSYGLDEEQRRAIAALEARCRDADGGRLKLEWAALEERRAGEVNDLLAWDADQLVGFCGRYRFGDSTPEVTGMVDPAHRGRGIGGELLDAMVQLCADWNDRRFLLVTARSSVAARRLAERRGARFEHAEHALVLTQLKGDAPADPDLSIREAASAADHEAVRRLRTVGFGYDSGQDREPTLVAERDGRVIATMRVTLDADGGRGIYGFVVDPALQGRGIGRDILRRVCRDALAAGAPSVHLEVMVDNDRALGLYTSTGFELQTTEDYYAFEVPGRAPPGAHPAQEAPRT